ncbi:MAG: hypothetical protein ACJAUD_001271 [Crocinitomicaceae bacterium]|jgi:hypothetical protein|tara:strand:+ start:434 stop:667 length:234 start_codon:yes stop_codon:yes gene_type:complete
MKIKNVIIATFSVALLASCGGTDACSCIEMGKEMAAESLAAGMDAEKQAEIVEKYASDVDACNEADYKEADYAECAE